MQRITRGVDVRHDFFGCFSMHLQKQVDREVVRVDSRSGPDYGLWFGRILV